MVEIGELVDNSDVIIDSEFYLQFQDLQLAVIKSSFYSLFEMILLLRDSEWALLEQRISQSELELREEELYSLSKVNEYFNELKQRIVRKETKKCFILLKLIINEVIPLNIRTVKRYYEEALIRVHSMVSSDVVTLTYGETGAGKSTTILFLAGCRMVVEMVNGRSHITGVDHQIPELASVVIGSTFKSETRYLNPIRIPPTSRFGKELLILDTAGFGDTRGPVTDIVNGLTLAMGLQKFKGFKLLAFLPFENFGAKGEGVQRLAHLLSQSIDVTDDNILQSVIYIFTKFESKMNIFAALDNICNSRLEEDRTIFDTDVAFGCILNDMLNKSNPDNKSYGAFVLDPLVDKPASLLSAIGKLNKIDNPQENFSVTMSENTKNVINLQLSRTTNCLQVALKNLNVPLIVYHMETLQIFNSILHENRSVKDATIAIKNIIEHAITEAYDKYLKPVKKMIIVNIIVTSDEFNELRRFYTFLKSMSCYNSLFENCPFSIDGMVEELCGIFQSKLKCDNEDTTNLKVLLCNLQICSELDSSIFQLFQRELNELYALITSKSNDLMASVGLYEVDELSQNLKFIHDIEIILNSFVFDRKHYNKFSMCAEAIIKYYYTLSQQLINSSRRLNNNTIYEFCRDLEIIRRGRDCQLLTMLLQLHVSSVSVSTKDEDSLDDISVSKSSSNDLYKTPTNISDMFDFILDQLLRAFSDRVKSLDDNLSLAMLNGVMKDLQLLRDNVREFEFISQSLYFKLDGTMKRIISKIPQDVEMMLSQFQTGTNNFNYQRLSTFLRNIFINKDWIEVEYPELYIRMNADIEDHVMSYCAGIKENIQYFDVNIHHPSCVDEALKLVNSVDKFYPIAKYFPRLMEELEEDRNSILSAIRNSLNVISQTFSFNDVSVEKLKSELSCYKEFQAELNSLRSSNMYMKEKEYESIDNVLKERSELESNILHLASEMTDDAKKKDRLNAIVVKHGQLKKSTDCNAANAAKKAKKYLKDQGYDNISVIYEELQKVSLQIETSENELKDKSNEIDNIINTYNSLLQSDELSSQQIKLLSNKNITMEELSFKILSLESKLGSVSNNNSGQYCFDRLNINIKYAFDSLLFLSKFELYSRMEISKYAVTVTESVQAFLCAYCDWLHRMIRISISKLSEFSKATSISSISISDAVFTITSALKILSDLRKYDSNGITQAYEKYEENIKYLDDLQSSLQVLMGQQFGDENATQLKQLILFTFDLRDLDKFLLPEKNFNCLHNRYTNSLHTALSDQFKEVLKSLTDKSYDMLPTLLTGYSTQFSSEQKNRISTYICSAVQSLIKDLNKRSLLLKNQLHLEQSRELVEFVKSGIDSLGILHQPIVMTCVQDSKLNSEVTTFLLTFKKSCNEAIQQGLQAAHAFLSHHNFIEAIQAEQLLTMFVSSELKDFFTSEVRDQLNALENAISVGVREQKEFVFLRFPLDSPKVFIEKLSRIAAVGYPNASNTIEEVKNKVKTLVNTEIDNVQAAGLTHDGRISKIAIIKHMLTFVPSDIEAEGLVRISQLESRFNVIQIDEKSLVDECKNAIDSDDIVVAYDRYCALSSMSSTRLSEVRSHLSRRLMFITRKLKPSMLNSDCLELFQTFELLNEYYRTFDKELVATIYTQAVEILSTFIDTSLNIVKNSHNQEAANVLKHLKIMTHFVNVKLYDLSPQFKILMDEFIVALGMTSLYMVSMSNFEFNIDDIRTLDVNKLFTWFKSIESWNDVVSSLKLLISTHPTIAALLRTDSTQYFETQRAVDYIDNIVIKVVDDVCNTDYQNNDFLAYDSICEETLAMNLNAIDKISALCSKFNSVLISHLHRDITIDVSKMRSHVENSISVLCNDLQSTVLRILDTPDDLTFKTFRLQFKPVSIFVKVNKNFIIRETTAISTLQQAENAIMGKMYQQKEDILKFVKSKDIVNVADILTTMKKYARELFMYSASINSVIDTVLSLLRKQLSSEQSTMLISELEKSEIGSEIISEHSDFAAIDLRNKREVMQNQDNIKYVLDNLEGSSLNKEALRSSYEVYIKKYKELLGMIMKLRQSTMDDGSVDTSELIDMIKRLTSKVKVVQRDKIVWNNIVLGILPELVALISALITLLKSPKSKSTDSANTVFMMPHAAQIVSIFRILGIGYERTAKDKTIMESVKDYLFAVPAVDGLKNNLVEVKTGEGKSVILAIVASVFALLGMEVDISCYSDYLSKRDSEEFEILYQKLKIDSRITYGTFNHLCEKLLNERVNVREVVSDMIKHNKDTNTALKTTKSKSFLPKILLIDEVDVFLSDQFFGAKYYPSFVLCDELISGLLKEMWASRNSVKSFHSITQIQALDSYAKCKEKFSHYESFLLEAAKDMVSSLNTFEKFTLKHVVVEDKLKCVQSDAIVEGANYGYNTVWNYYLENEKGNISEKSLHENTGILIDCGTISFAEMPHQFTFISGVTGTLKTLAKAEKDILKDVYNIVNYTFMPSVFGACNRTFDKSHHVLVVDKESYYMRLRTEIDNATGMGRPVLIFFESEAAMLEFYKSLNMADIHTTVNTITEKHSENERNLYVKQATSAGRVTLLPRVFGRGTDFICRSKAVLSEGGVHVIQTFFSTEKSEEVQIQGRCARQGNLGSYFQILLNSDLEWILGCEWRVKLEEIRGHLYDSMDTMRTQLYENKCKSKHHCIDHCKAQHNDTLAFMFALGVNELKSAIEFVKSQNKGTELLNKRSRTLLLLDATGSMGSMLGMAKNTICTVFSRVFTILKMQGLNPDNFLVQFAVYRDYDCGLDGVLQISNWESKAEQLEKFMDPSNVSAKGGDDYEEAIEIGLLHAVREAQSVGVTQVILIGDAPAKELDCIKQYRRDNGGGESQWNARFGPPTHYSDQLKILTSKGIPVHSFYLANGAKACFEKIAVKEVNAKCEYLNLSSAGGGVDQFLNFVTQEILRKSAGDQGEEAVLLYEKTYIRHTG